jgi:hypothetical protein
MSALGGKADRPCGVTQFNELVGSWVHFPPKPKLMPPIFISIYRPPAPVVLAIHSYIQLLFE